MAKRGVLNAFWIKILMAVLMLLDHIYYFLPGQPIWMTVLGRVVAPTFAFLVAEGLHHTQNRQAYIRRMLRFGLAMLCGNILLEIFLGESIGNSIFISLAIAAKFVDCVEQGRSGEKKAAQYLLYAVLLLLASTFFEGMWICPALVTLFYFLRERPLLMAVVYVGVVVPAIHLSPIGGTYQWAMVFALIPIALYNGERGPNGKVAKYFFYFFYPAHIWTLYLMRYFFC